MSTQHTPGPWEIGAYESGQMAVDGANGEQVTGFIAPADARLIAAAPDLLEALKEARATLATALKSTAPDWFVTEEDVKEHLSIKKMDAAIAKATGSTP
jgi:hypothetical protein